MHSERLRRWGGMSWKISTRSVPLSAATPLRSSSLMRSSLMPEIFSPMRMFSSGALTRGTSATATGISTRPISAWRTRSISTTVSSSTDDSGTVMWPVMYPFSPWISINGVWRSCPPTILITLSIRWMIPACSVFLIFTSVTGPVCGEK